MVKIYWKKRSKSKKKYFEKCCRHFKNLNMGIIVIEGLYVYSQLFAVHRQPLLL